ncbi:hypothetical protein TSUD_139310 [Trifolium subterraneum]|uniref:Uncharacterized protein n=1 Tax=Trifolium subterraneum TaxID=3900 RepID=A0A2Z6NI99_TRISU|nr:hypothetical protein TSUD_139310 [Trifolium subterraneum]
MAESQDRDSRPGTRRRIGANAANRAMAGATQEASVATMQAEISMMQTELMNRGFTCANALQNNTPASDATANKLQRSSAASIFQQFICSHQQQPHEHEQLQP